jgi:hypothetical protein
MGSSVHGLSKEGSVVAVLNPFLGESLEDFLEAAHLASVDDEGVVTEAREGALDNEVAELLHGDVHSELGGAISHGGHHRLHYDIDDLEDGGDHIVGHSGDTDGDGLLDHLPEGLGLLEGSGAGSGDSHEEEGAEAQKEKLLVSLLHVYNRGFK